MICHKIYTLWRLKKLVPQIGRILLHSNFILCTTYGTLWVFSKEVLKNCMSLVTEFFSPEICRWKIANLCKPWRQSSEVNLVDNFFNETGAKYNLNTVNRTSIRYRILSVAWDLAFQKNILAAMSKSFASPLYKIEVSHFQIGNHRNCNLATQKE